MKKAKYIDSIIGTVGDEKATSFHGGGKTHPGACVPGGMVHLSPDTVTGGDNGTGYNYCNNTIEGFSFNHMSGIGWYGDLGNIQIMPVVGDTDLRSGSNEEIPFLKGDKGWKSEFLHDREKATAGYYSVMLDRYNIQAEATATKHTGMLRLTYNNLNDARVIFNFSRRIAGKADYQEIKIISPTKLEGHIKCTSKNGGFGRGVGGISYNLYFVCELSTPAKEFKFFENENLNNANVCEFSGEDVGLIAYFGDGLKEPLVIRCGISYVDLDGARNNLLKECNTFNFDEVAQNAESEWESAFDFINVDTDDETDLTLFYTCLYHALFDPRTATDADGRFVIDDSAPLKANYEHRTMFSGWDVYRSEFPLLTVIRPNVVNDVANSLLKIAEYKNTSLPRWELMGIDSGCMVGDPALLVIADAYLKGIRGFDANKAYDIAMASSKAYKELYGKSFNSARPDCEPYQKNAYIPENLSSTLEYLVADYAMSKFANAMGKCEDAQYFEKRCSRYVDNYNKELGFMAPRDNNGNFMAVNNEYEETGCVESNIYQQSWFVPYDVEGLSKLFGYERTIELLEKLFEGADLTALWNENYNHSNEPCHNLTHYFNILGLPHRTQYWTRRVQKEAYRTGAFGFCGNEDTGQLSAWYVLSALGFAQVCPASGMYYVNTPLFKKAEIKLDKNYHSCLVTDKLTIECDNNPLEFIYIKSIELNGKKLDRWYVTFEELTNGGTLKFNLSKED